VDALHTAIAIIAIVLLIIVVHVDPVISLVLGSLYLGLATGLGFETTITTIAEGFGGIMTEVGLLIGFGVLLGSLLLATGALQRLVELLLHVLGARRLPYALSAVMTTLFPSIYVDVQLVLAAPLARSAAPRLGASGLGLMGGALTAGILVGYVFVVPGLGTVSIAGLLDVPLGTMLLFGLIVGPVTAVVTTLVFAWILKLGFWNPEKDEDPSEALLEEEALAAQYANEQAAAQENAEHGLPSTSRSGAEAATSGGAGSGDHPRRMPSLLVSLLPILVPLVLIATAAIVSTTGLVDEDGRPAEVLNFFGNPVLALFLGLLGAYILAKRAIGAKHTDEALSKGFDATGQILLITGVGGSLGAVIAATGLDKTLGELFSAESGTPVVLSLLLAWFVAAVLHLAIGSISVAAITAAGIIGPVLSEIDVAPAVVGLAIGAGALFALQVNSNFFWMFQTLLGVSTSGALKALTLVTSMASVISMPLIILLALVAPQ
jgi:H+/gluconate symporter-like permease